MESDHLNRLLFESQHEEHRETLLSRCRETIENLSQEVEEERCQRRAAEAEVRRLKKEAAYVEEQFNEAQVKIEVQTKEVTALAKDSQERQRMVTRLKEELKTAQQGRDDMQRIADSSSKELLKSQDKLHALKQELGHKQQVMDEWSKTLKAVDDRITSLTAENDEVKKELEEYVGKCDDLLRQNEHLVKGWKTAKEETQALHGELATLRSEGKEVIEVLQRHKRSFQQKLDETVEEKTAVIQGQISKCIDTLQGKLDTCSEELASLRRSKAHLQQEVGQLTRRNAEAEQTIEALKGQLTETRAQADAHRDQLRTHETDQELSTKQKEKHLKELSAELTSARVALRQKQQELELSTVENETAVKLTLHTKEAELTRLQGELMAKRSELNILKKDNELLATSTIRETENIRAQFEEDLRRIKTEFKQEYDRRLTKARLTLDQELQLKEAEIETAARDFRTELTEKDSEVDRLNADRKQLREIVEELQERLCGLTARYEKHSKKQARAESRLKKRDTEETERVRHKADEVRTKHRQEVELLQNELQRKDQEFERLRLKAKDKIERVMKHQTAWKERLMQEIGYLNKWLESNDVSVGPRIKAVTTRMELALISDRGS
jgi:chromosome segregation ATPase